MRVLVAFDKFKDSLSAREACDTAAHALRGSHPDWTLDLCPLTDGGEGFCEILTRSAGGELIASSVTDPLGDSVQAFFGLVPEPKIPAAARARLISAPARSASTTLAVIEMASASGLALLELDERDPWQTTTSGTGELICTAAELGAAAILLGVGGSATHDLGLGALTALGLECCDARGEPIDMPIPAHWHEIRHLQGAINPPLPPIKIACDVTNPLLGPMGAAATYGPQKGLRARDVAELDRASARIASMLCAHFKQPSALLEIPGSGAAGGISFGLMAAAGAQLLSGFDLVSAWLDLDPRIAAADVVITGEGRFDASSLHGKGPGAVASRALALGKPVHVFAGQLGPQAEFHLLSETHDRLARHEITPQGVALPEALRRTAQNLFSAIARSL